MTPTEIYGSAVTMRSLVNDWQSESRELPDLEIQLAALLDQAVAAAGDPAATVTVRVAGQANQGAAITDVPVRLPLSKLIEAKRAEIADKMEKLANLSAELEDACHKLLTFAPDQPKPDEPAAFTVEPSEPPVTKRAAATVAPQQQPGGGTNLAPPDADPKPLVGSGRVVGDDSFPFRSPV